MVLNTFNSLLSSLTVTMGEGGWTTTNSCFTLYPLPFSFFIKNEQLPYFLTLWDKDNLVIIEASGQVLVLLVVPLQCPDGLKLVYTPLINFMVFLDNGKRMSLTYQPHTTIISKVKLVSVTGFSVKTVTLFPCTKQVVRVHKEINKQKSKMPKQYIFSLVYSN